MQPNPAAQPKLYDAVVHPKPDAIVVYCSDPRFHAAFEKFIETELGLAKGQYLPLVVGGGAGVIGHPEHLPKEFKFMRERFELYRSIFPSLKRVVLINHQDCRYYESLKSKLRALLGSHFKISPEHAREDLALVLRVFHHALTHLGLAAEVYYAKFADPDHRQIVFEKL